MVRYRNIMSDLVRKFWRAIRRDGIIVTFGIIANRIAGLAIRLTPSSRAEIKELKRRSSEFDELYGVDTTGHIHQVKLKLNRNNASQLHAVSYKGSDSKYFRDAIRALPIDYKNFAFIDFGSGKGRAILMASEFPFKRIAGVEFSEQLHMIAQDNILRFHGDFLKCKDIQSICMDAVDYPLPDDCLVCYFFNPFDATIMAQVLLNIRKSLLRNPREIFIVYYNAMAGHLLDQADWLKMVARIGPVCIWRTALESQRSNK